MLDKLLEALVEAVAKAVKTTRERLADRLVRVASRVRDGQLIPDEAFNRTHDDQDLLESVADRIRGDEE